MIVSCPCGWGGVPTYLHGKPTSECPKCHETIPEPGRNDPCGCGSGKKFKRCCG